MPLGLLGAPWAVWRPSSVSLIALGPSGTILSFLGGHSERSWSALGVVFGAHLGRFRRLLSRLGALLGYFGTVLEASWAVLGRSSGPLGPSGSIGRPRRRTCETCAFNGQVCASRDPLGTHLGGLLGPRGDLLCRLGGLVARLWATLGVLERSFGVTGPFRGHRRSPCRIFGSG